VTGGTDVAEGHAANQMPATSTLGSLEELGLPQVFSPAEAAAVLRDAGLREMTECALRTRAYRKQVPFHRNGRRIIFTLSDLRDIASGEPHTPKHETQTATRPATSRSSHRHQSLPGHKATADLWRARRPGNCPARPKHSASRDARTAGPHDASHAGEVPARRPGAVRAATIPSVPRRRFHGLGA
jgi:hypothetical protein